MNLKDKCVWGELFVPFLLISQSLDLTDWQELSNHENFSLFHLTVLTNFLGEPWSIQLDNTGLDNFFNIKIVELLSYHTDDSQARETTVKIGFVVDQLYSQNCIAVDFLSLLWLNAISMGI